MRPVLIKPLLSRAAKFIMLLLLLSVGSLHVYAADAKQSVLYNPFVALLIAIMLILLLAIAVLANILTGSADVALQKWKRAKETVNKVMDAKVSILLIALAFTVPALAQDQEAAPAATADIVTGLSNTAFYLMIAVIFVELLVILTMLMQIKTLIRSQQEREKVIAGEAVEYKPKKREATWWTKINSFKPIEQEADLDLGHNYDGIRELDNRLPPWWLYGFYVTIIFAVIYLWRFHVSHSGPTQLEEYQNAVAQADIQIKEYLKQKGESVDENSVTYLSDAEDLSAGQINFTKSCISCHRADGGGEVGPNLTDDFWMHGGDIKDIFKTIKYGINAMPQWGNTYSNKQVAQLASYVKSLHGSNPANPKEAQGELYEEKPAEAAPATDSTATASVVRPDK